MKNTFHLTVLLLGTLSLVGCSYFDNDDELAMQKKEAIDLTGHQPEEKIVQPTPDIGEVINKSTDGSVEYYSLDGPGLMSQPTGAPPAAYSYADTSGAIPIQTVDAVPVGGNVPSVYSGDSSVDVVPLEGPMIASAPVPAPYQDNGRVVNAATGAIASVYFDRSSTQLDGTDREVITNIAANNAAGRNIAVEGFASTESNIADPIARKIANLKVSMERAFNVTKELISRGVAPEQVTTIAHGENRQAATSEESRRVDVRGL